ncbi:hypothetical protein Tco_0321624 [Tanacetum coccineum]
MTRQYYIPIHSLDIPENSWTLVLFMEYVKKSIDERALHKMEYDNRVNERQTQTTEEKIDTSNALDVLDASLVIIESNGTESQKPDTSSRSRNDADIRPIYDEEPMTEVQMDLLMDNVCYRTNSILSNLNPIIKERWKPTGRVFKNVVLRWVPTGKTFASSTTKVDSEPPNGSNADITNQCESEQALDVKKTNISENRASRNFNLMIIIMTSAENNTLGPNSKTTTMNQSRSKAGFKSCSSSSQDKLLTIRVGITIPLHIGNAEADKQNIRVILMVFTMKDGKSWLEPASKSSW